MKDLNWHELWLYILINIKSLFHSIPPLLIVILAILLLAGLVLVFFRKGVEHKRRFVWLLLLAEYVVLIYCTIVFLRPLQEFSAINFRPFWGFHAFLTGQNAVMAEKIMNLVVFVPIGALIGVANRGLKWYHVLLISVLLSVSIEFFQFVLKRGYAELDDVIHNALGAAIGFGLYKAIACIVCSVRSIKSCKAKVV